METPIWGWICPHFLAAEPRIFVASIPEIIIICPYFWVKIPPKNGIYFFWNKFLVGLHFFPSASSCLGCWLDPAFLDASIPVNRELWPRWEALTSRTCAAHLALKCRNMNSSDLENRPLLAESRLPNPSLAGSMMFYVHLRKCSMMLSSIADSI